MKYLLILLVFISSLIAQSESKSSKDNFDDYFSQKVEIVLPKTFKLGENKIKVVLEKPKMPSGFMVPIIFNLLESNSTIKPEVIGGYPKSTITIKEQGSYKFNLKVNLIYKTSCGGIQFSNLLTKDIDFEVK